MHNPASIDDVDVVQPIVSGLLSQLHTQGLFANTSPSDLLTAVGLAPPILVESESQTILTQESLIEKLTRGGGSKEDSKTSYRNYVLSSSLVVREIGLRAGQQALIVNGRVSPGFREGHIHDLITLSRLLVRFPGVTLSPTICGVWPPSN